MEHLRFNRLSVATLLAAYLVTGSLSPTTLLCQALFFKLDNSISVRDDQSIVLDERPYWTSHKHLTSPEQFSNDHILGAAEPWTSAIGSEQTLDIQAAILPSPAPLFSSNALRAPPLS